MYAAFARRSFLVFPCRVACVLLVLATSSAADLVAAYQQRGRQPGAVRGVYKTQITPHWFQDNTRFWYRNDLAGGTREFIVVIADPGTRQPAFDHARLAAGLSKAAGKDVTAQHLPFDAIEFVDNGKAASLQSGRDRVGRRPDLLRMFSRPDGDRCAPAEVSPEPEEEAGLLDAPASDRTAGPAAGPRRPWGPGGALAALAGRQVDGFRQGPQRLRRSGRRQGSAAQPGRQGGPRLRQLSWSPDSKTLVAFRIEPGERKEVYLIESSPHGGGRAKLHTRPYPAARRQVHRLRAEPLRRRPARSSSSPRSSAIDFGTPRLRWSRDGRHFTYEKIDRGHQRFRLIEVDAQTGKARNLIDEKTRDVHLDRPRRERRTCRR